MITAVAHAATDFNKPNPDRVLGWLDRGLTPEGATAAQQFAARLAPHRGKFAGVVSSDLKRALESAQPMADAVGTAVRSMPELRPWLLGQLQGQPSKEVDPIIEQLKQNGNAAPPGGETHNAFVQRFIPAAKSLIESPDHYLMVTHSRNLDLLKALAAAKGQGLKENAEAGDAINPLDHFTITPDYQLKKGTL